MLGEGEWDTGEGEWDTGDDGAGEGAKVVSEIGSEPTIGGIIVSIVVTSSVVPFTSQSTEMALFSSLLSPTPPDSVASLVTTIRLPTTPPPTSAMSISYCLPGWRP